MDVPLSKWLLLRGIHVYKLNTFMSRTKMKPADQSVSIMNINCWNSFGIRHLLYLFKFIYQLVKAALLNVSIFTGSWLVYCFMLTSSFSFGRRPLRNDVAGSIKQGQNTKIPISQLRNTFGFFVFAWKNSISSAEDSFECHWLMQLRWWLRNPLQRPRISTISFDIIRSMWGN